MSANSKIEWTDSTWNPWEGCTKVGPGCDHCYAEVRNSRFAGGQSINWGAGAPRRRTSESNWNNPLRWNAEADAFFAEHGRRQRVFCASLADVFDNEVSNKWRRDLFKLIEATPNLDWLILTKRIGNVRHMAPLPWIGGPMQHGPDPTNIHGGWPANVWIGATICNQEEADRDIPKLLQVPAAVRFLSMEPLLGSVDLSHWLDPERECNCMVPYEEGAGVHSPACKCVAQSELSWVIVGGESGHHARPMHPDWVRDLRDQCAAAGTPFLFKQWGEWTPGVNIERHAGIVKTASWFNREWSFSEEDLADDDGHIDNEPDLYRVGKKAAGRQLDGRTHDEFPRGAT
jgi:protein gp37